MTAEMAARYCRRQRVEVEKKAAESEAFLGNRQQYQSILRRSFNINFLSACVGGAAQRSQIDCLNDFLGQKMHFDGPRKSLVLE